VRDVTGDYTPNDAYTDSDTYFDWSSHGIRLPTTWMERKKQTNTKSTTIVQRACTAVIIYACMYIRHTLRKYNTETHSECGNAKYVVETACGHHQCYDPFIFAETLLFEVQQCWKDYRRADRTQDTSVGRRVEWVERANFLLAKINITNKNAQKQQQPTIACLFTRALLYE